VKATRLCSAFRRTARPAVTFRFRFDSRTLSQQHGHGVDPCRRRTLEASPILPVATWSGRARDGLVISRTVRAPDFTIDEGMAVFVAHEDQDPPLSPILLVSPVGTCAAYTGAMASGPQPSRRPRTP